MVSESCHRNTATARILTWYYPVCDPMDELSVTSKGQVTIPKAVRQKLGIRAGSKVKFRVVGDHAELIKVSTCAGLPTSGFGMLKSKRKSVPADFDVASLLASE